MDDLKRKMPRVSRGIFFIFFLPLISACSSIEQGQRAASMVQQKFHLSRKDYEINQIPVRSFFPLNQNPTASSNIRIYIEGDGLAWLDEGRISPNPTPPDPVGLKIASSDEGREPWVYLGRPCQYVWGSGCHSDLWTFGRFSSEVIDLYHTILTQLRQRYHNKTFTLIGYSGGGAIALLLGARRKDIQNIITFAGTLDSTEWTKIHGYTPLYLSMNPVDYIHSLQQIPQMHYVGGDDENMPTRVALSYKRFFNQKALVNLMIVPGVSHETGWEDFWSQEQKNKRPLSSF